MRRFFHTAVISGLSVAMLLWLAATLLPKPTLFAWQSWSTAYYDQNDELLRLTLADDDRYRLPLTLEEISPQIRQATTLYEDQYFDHHFGVNLIALWRAFITTYVSNERRVGGSTITMQVARHAFRIESRTILGKIQQIFAALWIELHYDKAQILAAYLNSVSYGGNIEGIGAASLIYFHKHARDLNLAEAMALAVVPQNPVKRNPQTASGYQKMLEARDILYQRWLTTMPQTESSSLENNGAKSHDLKNHSQENKSKKSEHLRLVKLWMSLPLQVYSTADLPFLAPHFVRYLNQRYRYLSGNIKTTLTLSHQQQLEKKIRAWVESQHDFGIHNAGAVLVNNHSHNIEAWVGSADFNNRDISGQVDIVTAKRSPGSTLKPFVYGLAMDQGKIHPLTLLKDVPQRYGAYTPENYDKQFAGPLTATDALITSRNVPAVSLATQLTSPVFYQWLQQAGISPLKAEQHYGMSLVLGGLDVSMLELAQLYTMLSSAGELQPLNTLLHTPLNTPPDASQPKTASRQLLSPESAWLVLHMLQQNPAPGHNLAQQMVARNSAKIGWKTGTSYAFRDAWAAGANDDYTLIVWVGNFDGKGNPNFIGRSAAGPLFFNIMRALSPVPEAEKRYNRAELNLQQVNICEPTGKLPEKYCPRQKAGWFIPGVSPITTSDIFRAVPFDIRTGQRACYHTKGKTRLEVYEFWPSDIRQIFSMAGIQRRQPPTAPTECALTSAYNGVHPEITSPVAGLEYQLRLNHRGDQAIPLQVTLDADASHAYWFADNEFIGKSSDNETLFWQARPGQYRLTVTDDRGLTDEQILSVRALQ